MIFDFIQSLLISTCLFLGITTSSFFSVFCISNFYNMPLVHLSFSLQKIQQHKNHICNNLLQLFITILPIFSFFILPKIQTITHRYMHSLFLMTEYSVFVELFYYLFHYTLHKNAWLYQNIHKKHHENVDVYPIDAFYIDYFDLLGINMSLLLPIYIVSLNYYEFICITYFYTTCGILVHSDIFVSHHKLHHKLFNYNYSFIFPIFDILFETSHHYSINYTS